jgi:CHASE3 domain sensor protein
MRIPCKIILAFIILLTLCITLITLFLYAFNLTVATVCNVTNAFFSTLDFAQYFNTTDSQLVQLANKCLGSNANGDIFAVINISQFQGL